MASKVSSSTIAILILSCGLISCDSAAGGRRPNNSGATIFNVMSYGAKPGTEEESSQAFVLAWRAACSFDRKAMVLIPPGVYILGETTFQGPCKNPTPVTVRLEGTLRAFSDLSAYPEKGWISFDEVSGLVLTGRGTIDGQGQNLWKYNDCDQDPNCKHLPASIYMTKVQNAWITSLKLINSMGFHMHVTNSERIVLRGLTITAPRDSPNTDGIHISKSRDVKVIRCIVKTGDDCISIGQGSSNVTVSMVTCGPGHGISVGSLGKVPNELDVQGLLVNNCTLISTNNGVRIKTYPASDPSKASGIVFADIVMEDVGNPIVINQNYGLKSTQPSMVKISDVTYHNIRGTTTSPVAVSLICSSGAPCLDIRLHNINLKLKGSGEVSSVCSNAIVAHVGVQIPPPCVSF
ncbi:exopolygalacturonase-like [Andrographis paniculata]|uniref:exopolygalacturonase-like n=1 Tax=Andrographis paniculata TaxID=175694 RepID=UPI0021E95736|nr:exopolygalacturonase-like [Andrographis paniculata]